MTLLLFCSLTAQIPPVEGTPAERAVFRTLDLRAGDGPAAEPGQEYTVHYTGWLQDGKKFDSSVDKGTPFEFSANCYLIRHARGWMSLGSAWEGPSRPGRRSCGGPMRPSCSGARTSVSE